MQLIIIIIIVLHNCVPKQSVHSEAQVIYNRPYDNYYIQWLLLLFLVIFSVSFSGSDDFLLLDLLDGNGA